MTQIRPMSNEASSRLELRRSELIAVAARLVAERGYQETTVADITGALGVSHGTFYTYFDNRRDILDAVLDERFAAAKDAVLGPVVEPAHTLDEFADAAADLARRLEAVMVADPGLIRFLAFEAPAVDQALIDRIDGWLTEVSHITRCRIDAGVHAGYLRADLDSYVVARMITAMIFAAAAGALAPEDAMPPVDFVDAFRDFVWHGLGVIPPLPHS